jgi:hypothetical protein
MKHPLQPICLLTAFALASLAPWAVADTAEDCRQMAAEESVPAEDLEDYVAECIAMIENEYPPEEAGELIPEPEPPEGASQQ